MFDEFRKFEENIDKLFAKIWEEYRSPLIVQSEGRKGRNRLPLLDLVDTEKELVTTVDLPGIKKDDIKINITDNMLEISGDTKHEEEVQEKGYIYKERRTGNFYRSVKLPYKIDPNNVKASYDNGLLHIQIPKAEIKQKIHVKVE